MFCTFCNTSVQYCFFLAILTTVWPVMKTQLCDIAYLTSLETPEALKEGFSLKFNCYLFLMLFSGCLLAKKFLLATLKL